MDIPAGYMLCQVGDLAATGAKGVHLPRGEGGRPLGIVVVAQGPHVRAYRNRCPHRGTPLETFPDEFLDRETGEFVCSTHGARFRVADGVCVSGPCMGERLEPVSVRVENGRIVLAEPSLPASVP